jgi:hypothetical protein
MAAPQSASPQPPLMNHYQRALIESPAPAPMLFAWASDATLGSLSQVAAENSAPSDFPVNRGAYSSPTGAHMQKSIAQQNAAYIAQEVELIVLAARRAAPSDAKTVEALRPFVEQIMSEMGVDETMARHVRRQLETKGVRLGR